MAEDIGITAFKTKDNGFRGRVFEREEDFIVQEIQKDGRVLTLEGEAEKEEQEKRDFLCFTLVKKGLSTAEAIRILSKESHTSIKRFGYLGNKDKNAITSQRISVFKGKREDFKTDYGKIHIMDFDYQDTGCKIGDLKGNMFSIMIRGFDGSEERLEGFKRESLRGLPNFYGPQRFGSSSINIEISKKILNRDFKGAVKAFLAGERQRNAVPKETQEKISRFIDEDKDCGKIEIPSFLWMEASMLQHLESSRHDYIGALRLIPKYLRLLILQSYQYYLFNRTLSEIVKNQVDTKEVPTVGYDFKDDGGEITKIIAGIIEEEKIDVASMKIKEMPEVSLKSFRRQAFFVPEGLEFERQQGNDLKARFSLEKGSYATILLGEFFHSYDFGRTKTEKGYKS